MRWAGHIVYMGKMRNAYYLYTLVRKPEGKRPLGGPRHIREDNITMDLSKIDWEGVDWIPLAQDRDQWQALVNMVTDFWGL
jgi:hypothetical protein